MASIREVYSAFVHIILPLRCINMGRVYAEYIVYSHAWSDAFVRGNTTTSPEANRLSIHVVCLYAIHSADT